MLVSHVTNPVTTQIWVQVGRFILKAVPSVCAAKALGNGEISSLSKAGQMLHRVRLGPVQTVSEADRLLDGG